MKKVAISLIFISLIGNTRVNSEPLSTTDLIKKSYDLANSGLTTESKNLLIDAIYSPEYKMSDGALRFALGRICLDLGDYHGAEYQWDIVIEKYPNSNEAKDIQFFGGIIDSLDVKGWYDYNFEKQLELSRLFWTPKEPTFHMNFESLIDPLTALEYLKTLYEKNNERGKRIIILFDYFMLIMGYNGNSFGFHNISENLNTWSQGSSYEFYEKVIAQEKESFLLSKIVLDTMKTAKQLKCFYFEYARIISDSIKSIDSNATYYIKTQYLLGLASGGATTPLLSKRLKKDAIPYFRNVINATENDETNPYRIFAIKWLSEIK